MKQPLRVLHLEDNRSYSDLVCSKLEEEGFAPEIICVESEEDFQNALKKGGFDLIIADYFLPNYDGIKALKVAQELQPHTPILLVSGTIGEEAAIESMKAGATDYVLKHWPERLIPAVRRALRESAEHKQRLRAEQQLQLREKYFRVVSENSLDIVSLLDRDGNFTYCTPAVERLLGYDPQELMGTNAFALLHKDDVERVKSEFQNCIAQPHSTVRSKFRVRHKDGSFRHFDSICKSLLDDPEIAGVVVNSRDVTDRHRIEHYNEVLSTLGSKLSAVISVEDAGKVIVESADRLFDWDAFTLDLYSHEEDKVYPILSIDTFGGEKKAIPKAEIDRNPTTRTRRILTQGAELLLREEPLSITPDGIAIGNKSRPSASLMFVPIRNRTRVIGILSIQSYKLKAYDEKDLNALQALADYCGGSLERIRAEQALRSSELRFHSIWENSVDGMRLTDENGTIVAVNEAFCKLAGMKREELEDKPFTITYAENADLEAKLARYRQRFKDRSVEKRIQRKLTFRNGKTVELEGSNSFVESPGQKTLLLGLFRDVTEHKRLEEQLRHSQKMDAIGQLAGGVAHDFNNILTVIQGHAALLRSAGEIKGPLSGSAEQICQAAERAAGLTRQLLTFSRRQMMQPKQLDLNQTVSNMTKMLGRILGEDIALQCNYSPDTPLIHADVGMIEQILLNLAVNSRDAMPTGGQLTIRIAVLKLEGEAIWQHTEGREGEFVRLSMTDTGTGIDPAVLPHIYEPFFTTKAVGKGTGLGLATSQQIIFEHNGHLVLDSQAGKGSTFSILLPL